MKRKGVRQRDQSDCGPACLAYISSLFGIEANVMMIRQWARTNTAGTSVYGIMKAAEKLALHAEALRCDEAALAKLRMPLIAHCDAGGGRWHFVTLTKQTADYVWAMDPADGKCNKIDSKIFLEKWTGVVIVFEQLTKTEVSRQRSTIFRLGELIKSHSRVLAFVVVSSIFYAICGLITSLYLQEVVDRIVYSKDHSRLHQLSFLMIIVLAFQCTAAVVRSRLILFLSRKIDIDLVTGFFRTLSQLPLSLLSRMQKGELLNRADDAIKITRFIGDTAPAIVVDLLFIFFSLAMMMFYNAGLAMMNLMMIPVFIWLYLWWDKVNDRMHRKVVSAAAVADSSMVECLHSLNTTRLLQAEEFVLNRLEGNRREYANKVHHAGLLNTSVEATTEFLTRGSCIAIVWIGSLLVIRSDLSPGELVSMYSLTGYFMLPALDVISGGKKIRETMIAAERYFELSSVAVQQQSIERTVDVEPGNIEFENITFGYQHGNPVLKNFNLTVKQKQVVGIKGVSGSGKSTVLSLLCRHYEPDMGSIKINGVNIDRLDLDRLLGLISVVPQQIDLYSASLRDNVCLSLPYEQDWFVEVCRRSGVNEFCGPGPSDSRLIITENGNNLSGGQRQKIAIARALYRRSPILLMDEPTSSMDEASEYKIVQTIDWYKNLGNTVIIISHSDIALKICDNIVIL